MTLIDSVAQNPSQNKKLGSIAAAINFEVGVDIRCSHDMDIGKWLNLVHMTKENNNGELGDRFFMITRKEDSQELMINIASPIKDNGTRGTFVNCTSGEWNTYKLVQAQNPEKSSNFKMIEMN